MQAVILAAGKSTRMYPLTLDKPKPLLKIDGKTLIEYSLDQLKGIADEVIIVVGYKKEMIKKHLGKNYKGIAISYIYQTKQLGTAHALGLCRPKIKNDFIIMMGDDLYDRNDIKQLLKHKYAVLAKKVMNPERFGVFVVKGSKVVDLIEKPKKFVSDMANTGCYKLDKGIFPMIEKVKKSARKEYELTDAIRELAKKKNVYAAKAKRWLPIAYPSDLEKAKRLFRK